MPEDLSLIPTEDMLNEIQKRFDLFFAAGLKIRDISKEFSPPKHSYFIRFTPPTWQNLGFISIVKAQCEKQFLSQDITPGFDSDKL